MNPTFRPSFAALVVGLLPRGRSRRLRLRRRLLDGVGGTGRRRGDQSPRPPSTGRANPTKAAVRMVVRNGTGTDDTLVAVTSPIAAARPRCTAPRPTPTAAPSWWPSPSCAIPARSSVTFEPGGLHVMLTGITDDIQVGDDVPLTLTFEHAGTVTATAEVVEPRHRARKAPMTTTDPSLWDRRRFLGAAAAAAGLARRGPRRAAASAGPAHRTPPTRPAARRAGAATLVDPGPREARRHLHRHERRARSRSGRRPRASSRCCSSATRTAPTCAPPRSTPLARAIEAIGDGPGSNPMVLFVGVDVARDTPEQLQTYLGDASTPRSSGLTGTEAVIAEANKAGAEPADRDRGARRERRVPRGPLVEGLRVQPGQPGPPLLRRRRRPPGAVGPGPAPARRGHLPVSRLHAMTWWCSSSPAQLDVDATSPTSGAWLIVAARARRWPPGGTGGAASRSPSSTPARPPRSSGAAAPYPSSSGAPAPSSFWFGIVGLWACLDWPLASLGAGYLATAQMVRQVLMVFAVAPAAAVRLPRRRWPSGCSAGAAASRCCAGRPGPSSPSRSPRVTLLAVNAPAILDPLVATPYGAFLLDFIWIAPGFVLWMPVQCPHPGVPRLTGARGAGVPDRPVDRPGPARLLHDLGRLPDLLDLRPGAPSHRRVRRGHRPADGGGDPAGRRHGRALAADLVPLPALGLPADGAGPSAAETHHGGIRHRAVDSCGVFVKICGITREDDALLAVAMGADARRVHLRPVEAPDRPGAWPATSSGGCRPRSSPSACSATRPRRAWSRS